MEGGRARVTVEVVLVASKEAGIVKFLLVASLCLLCPVRG